MTLISLADVERSFGEHVVLEGVGLSIDESDRLGIIGDNGAGKTTLVKILAGAEDPDRGQRIARKGLRIAYLQQIPQIAAGTTLLEFVARGDGTFDALETRISELAHELEVHPGDKALLAEYGHLQSAFEAGGGYERGHLCERVLTGIGFAESEWGKDCSVLSGGEKTRLMLCALMTSPAELLILDEPTNHLDLEAIAFLEDHVKRFAGAVITVSHDRAFLDQTCTSILEVEGGKATRFKGNWSAYQKQRDAAILAQARSYKDQQEYLAKEMEFIRRNMAGRMSVQAKGRLKRLQRLELIQRPKGQRAAMKLSFQGGRGSAGQTILEAQDLGLKLPNGRVLLEGANFRLYHGEVLGILGRNGTGKSTLLRCLVGETQPQKGKIARAVGVKGGFFSQEMHDLPRHGTILEALRAVDPQADEKSLRDHLALFLFTGDDAERPVEGLSGGEKRRLCLARLTRGHYDYLCLDEPTNHLDISAREALEEALMEYTGAVLVVSHDRAFVDKLVDRVVLVHEGRVRTFDGGFAKALAAIEAERLATRAEVAQAREKERVRAEREKAADPTPPSQAAQGGAPRIRNPILFEKLEKRIMALEAEQQELEQRMLDPENYASRDKMQKLLTRKAEVAAELAEAYTKWETWQ